MWYILTDAVEAETGIRKQPRLTQKVDGYPTRAMNATEASMEAAAVDTFDPLHENKNIANEYVPTPRNQTVNKMDTIVIVLVYLKCYLVTNNQ